MSSIEWTDKTWNPTVGCSRISPGCEHCYAERFAGRKLSDAHRGLTVRGSKGARWTGAVRCFPNRLAQPLRWRKPQRIFVDSMSDLFHEAIPVEFVDSVFGVILACGVLSNHRHTFQILTKRPHRMASYLSTDPSELVKRWARAGDAHVALNDPDQLFSEYVEACCRMPEPIPSRAIRIAEPWANPQNVFPLRNVWLGVSCEDQTTLGERLPILIDTPAATRFLSIEPMLGPIFLPRDLRSIDLVIVGGESGPGARPCWIDAIHRIITDCAEAQVATFVKQLGARPYRLGEIPEPDCNCREFACPHRMSFPPVQWLTLKSAKGGNPDEWPEDLRVRELPKP